MATFFKRKIENRLIKKSKIAWKLKATLITIALISLSLGVYLIVRTINTFFDENYLQFNRVVEVILKRPVEIRKREPKTIQVFLDYPDEIDTPLEMYICEKFGAYECKPALAIANAESGLREDAINVNSNGTIDLGPFQINQQNWKIPGCALKDIVHSEKNVDCAYIIWDRADGVEGNGKGNWSPWTVARSGKYLDFFK